MQFSWSDGCGGGSYHISGVNNVASVNIWVCLKMVSTPKANGFADHDPVFKWLFHWED